MGPIRAVMRDDFSAEAVRVEKGSAKTARLRHPHLNGGHLFRQVTHPVVKVSHHLPEVMPHSGRVSAHFGEVRAHFPEVSHPCGKVSREIEKVMPPFPDVVHHLEKVSDHPGEVMGSDAGLSCLFTTPPVQAASQRPRDVAAGRCRWKGDR